MITWDFDASIPDDWIDEAGDKVDDLDGVFDAIGRLLVDSVHKNFQAEGRPDPWMPRVDNLPHPILRKTGNLYNSIAYDVNGLEVAVYAEADYGQYHDEGTSRLPRRPFLLMQNEDEDEIMDLVAKFFMD